MNKRSLAAVSVLAVLGLAGCGKLGKPDPNTITKINSHIDDTSSVSFDIEPTAEQTESEAETETEPVQYIEIEDVDAFVDELMQDMTLEEKVGQMLFVRADALESGFESSVVNDDTIGGVTYVDDMMKKSLEKYHVGGVVLFEKNIIDEKQLRTLTADLQAKSALPLFIGVNELGGDYAPIANNVNFDVPLFENMNVIGSSGNEEDAKQLGSAIGGYLSGYGVNIDFAPVADISLNYENVKDKNFSADQYITAKMVDAEIDGMHEGGVMTAVKNFPGYADGDAEGEQIFYNGDLWEYIMGFEAIPYINVLEKTDMLMIGHVDLPSVVSDGMPASMSQQFIQEKVRDELGYDGVVISDSMSAYSVLNNISQRESAVNAINAGVDIVLMPYDLEETFDAVLTAVNRGKISEDTINESVKRILTLKAENGLFTQPVAE